MKYSLPAIFLLAVCCASCTASLHPPGCPEPQLSREEVISIVDEEFPEQEKGAMQDRRSKITIRRDGCDYLYKEVGLPRTPGDYLLVRVSPRGEVLDFLPGA